MMKGTRKALEGPSANEETFVQRKLDEANAVLRRMDVSVFENKIVQKRKNER
ncbi:hypothetical protein LZD49_22505 [Dyadobacter sp. CY261]|uniref:hypothetical protein n=1 Tax=Dyadobacter sp. CY261 TaxID=2907203 RepID=UPI001F1FBEC0|nr:hypothetical protein [Dyadobacter sp. CY261]MCF0073269.1 hypothetical protein [Dyadobacter sp. CY261]